MTPDSILIELLERIGANNGAAIFITNQELEEWPLDLVRLIKSYGLITQAPPAINTVCPECEQSCTMPVNILTNQNKIPTAFTVCDKRSDINRIYIPLNQIERCQASGDSLVKLISKLLELPLPVTNATNSSRWEIGLFRGSKHSSYLVLGTDNKLVILAAGHKLALDELLTFTNGKISIDKRKIIRAVDNPAISGDDTEPTLQRRKRLKNRVNKLRQNGTKGFLKKVAKEEGISVTRLKQLTGKKSNFPN